MRGVFSLVWVSASFLKQSQGDEITRKGIKPSELKGGDEITQGGGGVISLPQEKRFLGGLDVGKATKWLYQQLGPVFRQLSIGKKKQSYRYEIQRKKVLSPKKVMKLPAMTVLCTLV